MKKVSKILFVAIVMAVATISGCILTFSSVDIISPYVVITSPDEGDNVSLPFTVSGTVYEDESSLTGVYISVDGGNTYTIVPGTADLAASTSDQNWSYQVTDMTGTAIKVYAADSSDNTSSVITVNVNFNLEVEPNDTTNTANLIGSAGYIDGFTSSSTDNDYYMIYLSSLNTYAISTTTNSFSVANTNGVDTRIAIYTSGGILEGSDDDSGTPAGYSKIASYVPPVSGYYYIQVYSPFYDTTGYYRLSVVTQ